MKSTYVYPPSDCASRDTLIPIFSELKHYREFDYHLENGFAIVRNASIDLALQIQNAGFAYVPLLALYQKYLGFDDPEFNWGKKLKDDPNHRIIESIETSFLIPNIWNEAIEDRCAFRGNEDSFKNLSSSCEQIPFSELEKFCIALAKNSDIEAILIVPPTSENKARFVVTSKDKIDAQMDDIEVDINDLSLANLHDFYHTQLDRVLEQMDSHRQKVGVKRRRKNPFYYIEPLFVDFFKQRGSTGEWFDYVQMVQFGRLFHGNLISSVMPKGASLFTSELPACYRIRR